MADKLVIEKMYAFIADSDEGEGVCGFHSEMGWMPMVGADMKRVDDLMLVAQNIANTAGKNITLLEFSVRKKIKVIEPKEEK